LGPGRGVALWDLQGWLGICRGVGLGVDVAVAASGLRLRARRGISGLLEEFGGHGEGWVGAGFEQAAVRQDLVDDDRILEEGDDPAPTKAVRAKQDVDVEAALHQGGPVDVGIGARAGLLAFAGCRDGFRDLRASLACSAARRQITFARARRRLWDNLRAALRA
jgi:hypothetical protein